MYGALNIANITVPVKVRIMGMVSKLWLVGLVLVILPTRPYRQYLVHHNPEHLHVPRGKLSQVNTTLFKTVGFDMDCYHLKYKLLVIVGVSVIRKIFREPVVKTIKYIKSNGWFRTYAININTEMYFHLKDDPSVFNGTHYAPTTDHFDDVKIA